MKLLICDDDISTVDVIQSQLDCTELGFSQILRAYNGDAATKLIARELPDVILCDIGMPKKNGIEVLEFIFENEIDTEFCFLTCYDDFDYAKTAIRYGAANYITKPFEMEELKAAVQGMAKAAQKKKTRVSLSGQQTQRDSVINSVLRQISDGLYGTSVPAVASVLARNGLFISAESQWYMVLSCVDITDALKTEWNRELLMYTIGRLHDETLADYIGSAYTLINSDNRFVECVCFVPAGQCDEALLHQRCDQLIQLFADHTGLRPTILISESFALHTAADIKKQMAADMESLRVYAGRIFRMGEDNGAGRKRADFLDAAQILMYLKKHNCSGYLDYFGTVTHRIATSPDYTREVLDSLRRELINVFVSCLQDNGISSQSLFESSGSADLNARSVRSAGDMMRFAENLFLRTEELLRNLADADDIIARADAYIREHFREDINRDDVAAVACITPNYLSKQFRSKKGMNLREYINTIRVEEAKRLLLTTNLSVSEVAGLSGYDNISYFSTVFRKHTGMSPIDWRNAESSTGDEA